MVSTASTVIEFCTPDTVRLAQWPLITTVLEIPLTLTTLSLQAIVRFSLIPAMLSWPPAGGVGEVDGADDRVLLVEGGGSVGLFAGEVNGTEIVGGDGMIDRTPESWCAVKAAMPPARATTPMTMMVPRIHHMRFPEGGFGGGPETGPP